MSANEIIALCALVISTFSIGLTIHFSRLQVGHYKKSVRPIAQIILGDYEDSLYVEVHNVGVGPLLISQLLIHYKDEKYSRLIDLFGDIDQVWDDFVETVDGRAIPVGGKIVLAKITPENNQIRDKVRELLSQVTIVVDYNDVYNQEFHTEKTLDFFGRSL